MKEWLLAQMLTTFCLQVTCQVTTWLFVITQMNVDYLANPNIFFFLHQTILLLLKPPIKTTCKTLQLHLIVQ